MSDAEGIARRVYRLAWLVTGDAGRAGRVTSTVLARHQQARGLPDHRLDRLTILAARRELGTGPAPGPEPLASLEPQWREAWILIRVLGHSLRESARAMDCSRAAIRRHLRLADAEVSGAPGGRSEPLDDIATARVAESVESVRRGLAGVQPPADLAPRVVRRTRVRRVVVTSIKIVAATGLLATLVLVARHLIAEAMSAPSRTPDAPALAPADDGPGRPRSESLP